MDEYVEVQHEKPSDAIDFGSEEEDEVHLKAFSSRVLPGLSPAQASAIAAVFYEASGPDKIVHAQEIEALAAKVFQDTLTDEMLDIIIDMTDGLDKVSLLEFQNIIVTVMSKTTRWGRLKTDVQGPVGFDSIHTQINKKLMKRGFEFNILVVGQSGLGKSTLVDTLFNGAISRSSAHADHGEHIPYTVPSTTEVKTITHVIEEGGVRLKLSVTDTPGFGDHINNSHCSAPILDFIDQQYSVYLDSELAVRRQRYIPDRRVHVCLYFIPPTGHGLSSLDIEMLKILHKQVNVVPIMAKADSFTVEERDAFKARIREDLEANGIVTYPSPREDESDEEIALNTRIREMMPFAVVGANTTRTVAGKQVRGRETRVGFIEIENPNHCDFAALRNMLIRTNMQDLKEVTSLIHYEAYRRRNLEVGGESRS